MMKPRIITPADIDRERVEQARQMTPEQRLAAGGDLFDYACEASKAGIRMRHADADEQTVLRLLRERIEIGEQLERQSVLERDRDRRG